MKLKPEATAVLRDLERRDEIDVQDGTPKERRVRCITELMGQFLHMMILMARPRQILECGTSAGYSTIWMATAAEQIGASVVSIDSDADKILWARGNIERAGLAKVVKVVHAEAARFISEATGSFDMVFMDHGASFYVETFDALVPKLGVGGSVLVDGWKCVERWDTVPALVDYKSRVLGDPDFKTFLLPVQKGMMISTRVRATGQAAAY
jgi:predicted O-methyltransferase YrrM